MARSGRGFGLLSRKLIAIFLIAVVSLTAPLPSWAPWSPVPKAEAAVGVDDLILIIITALLEVAIFLVKMPLAEEADGIAETAASQLLYQALTSDQLENWASLENELYDLDHLGLSSKTFQDIELNALYSALSGAGALSFGWDAAKFSAQNPGYRNVTGGAVIFSEEYSKRLAGLANYTKGMITANNSEARDIVNRHLPVMNELASSQLEAGKHMEAGYRELLEANNQIYNFGNNQATRMRSDAMRDIDGVAQYELNETQERSDRQAAFEPAVRSWKTTGASAGY
jgi:hypothetical protein